MWREGDGREAFSIGLRPGQADALEKLIMDYERGVRRLVIELPTGVGKTRVAIEFIKYLWRRIGRVRCLVVVPRRALIENPWRKEIQRWMADEPPKTAYVTGEFPPRHREIIYREFDGDMLLTTVTAFNNDLILGRISLDNFKIVLFDEVHNVVAYSEEPGRYRYSLNYRGMALRLTTSEDTVVIGLTIPETERTYEAERHLNAVGVSSTLTPVPETKTYVIELDSGSARRLDLFISSRIARIRNALRGVLGNKMPWKITDERLKEILMEKGVPEEEWGRYQGLLNRYRSLYQLRQDLFEGNDRRALEHLNRLIRRSSEDYEQLMRHVIDACVLKRLALAELIVRRCELGEKVMVYAKYRMSAGLLRDTLFHVYGLEAATFMGGDSPSRLRDLVERYQVVIFTPVAKEGLDLPEFDTLIHVSGHADEFTRRQIRGRIRGGREYYVVFGDTWDERRLLKNMPEAEGPLRIPELHEDSEVRLPVKNIAPGVYEVELVEADKAPYLSLPRYVYDRLIDRFESYGYSSAIGRFGEALAAYHYESTGRRVYKVSTALLRRRIIGLNRRQLSLVRRLASVIPNPPVDLLAVGRPKPLLVEVKTMTTFRPLENTLERIPASFIHELHRAGLALVSAIVRVEHDKKAGRIKTVVERRGTV